VLIREIREIRVKNLCFIPPVSNAEFGLRIVSWERRRPGGCRRDASAPRERRFFQAKIGVAALSIILSDYD
jgi:hypothetical protein